MPPRLASALVLGALVPALALTGCSTPDPGSASTTSNAATTGSTTGPTPSPTGASATPTAGGGLAAYGTQVESPGPFALAEVARLDEPWAMEFLPDGRALVTRRSGQLVLLDPPTGRLTEVGGTPTVVHEGQGGLGDVVLGPTFATDGTLYLTWVEAGAGGTGAVLGRGRLVLGDAPRVEALSVIWRQTPKVGGAGHFSHRVAVSPDGAHLFVTSGERQQMTPAQDLTNTLGTIVRLTLDGAPAPGNPFAERGGVSREIWTYGHRNPLGIAFDADGRLWSTEMGPKGGDELNLVERGKNYGWPLASNGSHYDGTDIPDHRAGDGFAAPKAFWTPSISPGSLLVYSGAAFPQWRGDAFIGALSGQALVRVDLDGESAAPGDRWDIQARIRGVEEAPDGSIWLLEDGDGARVLRLTPRA